MKKQQRRVGKYTEAKYIVVYHTENYGRKFMYCFNEDISLSLKAADKYKRPGTSIFVYKVTNVGIVKLVTDWKK